MTPDAPLSERERRFLSKVEIVTESGCWIWMDAVHKYGQFCFDNKRTLAHRFAYEFYKGPIPQGLQIDHLCRVQSCVNPHHLEAVTSRENTLRGTTGPALNVKKTHCKHGHEFNEENTLLVKNGLERVCLKCREVYNARKRYERTRKT